MLAPETAFNRRGLLMGRKIARPAIAFLILAALATAAWAAAKGPIARGDYVSTHPRLSVYVDQPPTKVELYLSCPTSPTVSEYWDSSFLPLKHGAFSFDKKTTISTENGATFGHVKGAVLFTGKFSGGKFTGTAQLVGSACPKSKYTAKYDKHANSGN
jgi:hypothetical protein